MSLGLSVVGCGMVTAVGFNAAASCAALRGGIRGVEIDNLWDRTAGDYLGAGRPKTPQWWEGREVISMHAAAAIEECLAGAAADLADARVRPADVPVLFLVAPPDRPHRWPDLDARALEDLEAWLGRPLARGSRLVPRGRTGLAQALAAVQPLVAAGAPYCVIAGAESFLRQVIVDHYIDERRLLCAANSNGFSPGEAAAAVLVGRTGTRPGPELALLGVGMAHDPSGAGGTAQHPVTGDSLTDATRQALATAGLTMADIDLRLSDANGEHFKFREVTIADARLLRPRPPSARPRRFGYLEHEHPIEYVGEVGAAIFPILLGAAYDAGRNRQLAGPRVLLHASEDDGERVAVVAQYRANGA